MADITAEARKLLGAGVREIVLVAQDTTHYGTELSPPVDLNQLLLQLSDLSEDFWIRFLYGHPSRMNTALIKTVAARSNICSYFDIPIQHASDRLLKRMGRRYDREDLIRMFDTIRTLVPNASLRTTAIVGFPGETDADVEALLLLMEKIQFDHLGVFTYSDADDLPSHRLSGHVSAKVAEARRAYLMGRQQEISRKNNEKYLGQTLSVLVEEVAEENLFIGRHAGQAPEVDGITYIHVNSPHCVVKTGIFTRVRIIDTLEYDLVGETLEPVTDM